MSTFTPSDGDAPRTHAADEAIREQALDWISRRELTLSAAEEAEFKAWLAADPRHGEAVQAIQPAWTEINRFRRTGRGAELRRQVAGAVRRRRRKLALTVVSLGTAALVVFGLMFPAANRPAERLAPSIVQRADRQILPDGSTVELNSGAEIVVEFAPALRGVRLVRGEALFEVAKDPHRPFVVTAGTVAVRAVGTAFVVRVDPAAIDVLVTEGRVTVNPGRDEPRGDRAPDIAGSPHQSPVALAPRRAADSELLVAAGQRINVPVNPAPEQALTPRAVSTRDVATALEWRNRRVEFNGTSVAEAVQLFNRDNVVKLVVSDPGTAALRITGVFWTSDPEAFSRVLATSFGLSVQRRAADQIMLGR